MALVAAGCSGCAGSAGLLVADVHETEGARVVALQSFGTSVRWLADDGGLSLGYERRIYIYPDGVADLPQPGSHYFFIRLPEAAPVALHTVVVGFDLRATSSEAGVTLGYFQNTLLARVAAGEDIFLNLRFDPSDVQATRLIYCKGGRLC